MRVAFVSIPRFPCAVEVQRDSALARRPLIVGDAEQPKRVLDCDALTAAQGVSPGAPIRKALALCPDAVVIAPDPVLYRARWESVLDALYGISPEVEDEDLGRAYVNVRGLLPHYRDEDALAAHLVDVVRGAISLEARAGIAEGKFPAVVAATFLDAGEARAIPAGAEAALLRNFGVSLLPVDDEIVLRLQMFGLESIGDVAALSLPELQSQFGFAGERLWQLANGIDEERLRPRPQMERIEASLSFEAPVAGIDVIVAAAKQLLSRLLLPLRGRAAREVALQAELATGRGWERRIVMREAVSDRERLAFVLRASLQNAPPPNAIRSLSLRLGGLTGETGKQLSLGERGRLQQQLEESIRQLKVLYGYSPVFSCVDVEPWSVIPEERQILVESDA